MPCLIAFIGPLLAKIGLGMGTNMIGKLPVEFAKIFRKKEEEEIPDPERPFGYDFTKGQSIGPGLIAQSRYNPSRSIASKYRV